MLWIALNLPQLPLDTVLRCRSDASILTAPVIVTERKRVGWCNQAAADIGVRAGMSEANAWTLSAQLQAYPREPEQEHKALHEVALWALHFTPQVTLRASGVLLEVEASLRLFNGLEPLLAQLLSGITDLGLQTQSATAPTATAAWLLACSGIDWQKNPQDPLAAIPLSAIDAALPHLDTLRDIGCNTFGQLRRMPRAGIARRFGNALLREIDRACGDEAEVHAWFTAPATFDATLELPAQVEHTDALLFAARRLLLQLTGWLNAHQSAITSITLWLHHEPTRQRDHRSTPVVIQLAAGSRDPEHLTLLLRERLAQVALIAPVIELALTADQIVALAAPNTELFATAVSQAESITRLIERLQSRLGYTAVRQLSLHADHRPEKSFEVVPLSGNQRKGRDVCLPTTAASARPAWLLPQPLQLVTRQHKPFYQSPLALLVGPERIESGWWDDALAQRDYFIAENELGVLLWIFRLRSGSGQHGGGGSGWFLHGYFA
jgi:protein ImuB